MSSPAVIYAARSTEDRRGSIPDQLADGRALAERDGLSVIAQYSDEAASAYRGNRGNGLARAMEHAERIGAALIVQHSDRLARGDGAQAQHLVELVLRARKAGVTLRSVQDPQTFDSMGLVYAALMGDRNYEDSARKSASVRDGLKRRRDCAGSRSARSRSATAPSTWSWTGSRRRVASWTTRAPRCTSASSRRTSAA